MQAAPIPLTFAKALEAKRSYRKVPSIDKLKFLTSCNSEQEWKKAATIMTLLNSCVITIKKAGEMLRKHLNMRRLQRQMLIYLNIDNWSKFEQLYPTHSVEDKLEILLGSLGNPSVHCSARSTGWFDSEKGVDPATQLKSPDPLILKYLTEAKRYNHVRSRLASDIEGLTGKPPKHYISAQSSIQHNPGGSIYIS